jgi:hypothetical protein
MKAGGGVKEIINENESIEGGEMKMAKMKENIGVISA